MSHWSRRRIAKKKTKEEFMGLQENRDSNARNQVGIGEVEESAKK